MSEQSGTKRKRSAIACTVCHDRKVRCNVALSGVPCSNCALDGTQCRIYGRRLSVGPERSIRPRIAPSTSEALYPPTPSTVVSNTAASLQSDVQATRTPAQHTPTLTQTSAQDNQRSSHRASPVATDAPLVAFHAGESQGLEFLSDICQPNRPFKGNIYIIGRQRSNLPDSETARVLEACPLPNAHISDELVRCYFLYVHSFLPLLNAAEFLQAYDTNPDKVSQLLLWSVYFAAASFLDSDMLQETGCPTRKAFKEYLYKQAKTLYDAHIELDKTTIIQSAILLAYYYIDLEDLDGSWHWIGIALSLCHTIGLHRNPRWDLLQRSPFSSAQCALWRRLWWCCYYRETWLALGLGRPMRINSDDCDALMPSSQDVLAELEKLNLDLRKRYMPGELQSLVDLWINFLHLTLRVEIVLATNYRIRRPAVSQAQLEQQDRDIWMLYERIYDLQGHPSRLQSLHTHLLRTYYNSVIIALFRPHINGTDESPKGNSEALRTMALERCRTAASNTTYSLNELVSSDLVDVCPTMLITAMMSAMQIHFYEHHRLGGLARQHALHNLKLHIMVLDHLRKTYWPADMQHKLFSDAIKTLEAPKPARDGPAVKDMQQGRDEAPSRSSMEQQTHEGLAQQPFEMNGEASVDGVLGTHDPALDDFFLSFNPFNMAAYDRTYFAMPNDWSLGSGDVS